MAYRPNNPFGTFTGTLTGGSMPQMPQGLVPPIPGGGDRIPPPGGDAPPPYPGDPERPTPKPPAGTDTGSGPCPNTGECRDTVTSQCRMPGGNEKINETDDATRPTGGGRGYCRQLDPGVRGGGGGAGGVAGKPLSFSDPANLQSDVIWQQILKRLNAPSRYTPEVMSGFMSEAKLRGDQQQNLQLQASDESLQRRGILRSDIAAGAEREIRGQASTALLSEQNKLNRAKIDADFQDKSQAIKEGMDWINSLRDYVARMSGTKAQYDVGMANVQLGYARLAQEMDYLREQYAQNLTLCISAGICR